MLHREAVSRGGGGRGWAELYLALSACCSAPFRFGLTGAVPALSALFLSPAQQQPAVGHLLTQGWVHRAVPGSHSSPIQTALHSLVCSTRGREGEQGVIQCGGNNDWAPFEGNRSGKSALENNKGCSSGK